MIEIKNVSMNFSDSGRSFKVLEDVSLSIPEGSVYGFLGSNGAGKSTLMRMMCGVYRPSGGSILIDGEEVFDNPDAKRKIFFVNDETVQFSSFTPDGLRKYYKRMYPDFSDETFIRLAERLELPLTRPLSTFSKGMKRQTLVLIGLSCKTRYLILDEAFDGLDPAMRKIVRQMIADEIFDRNASLIVSSHNISEIKNLCDRAMLLHKGKLIFADEIDEIRSGLSKVQIADRKRRITKESLSEAGLEILDFSVFGSVYRAVVRGGGKEVRKKLLSLDADLAETVPLTLEEIFIYELEARGYGNIVQED